MVLLVHHQHRAFVLDALRDKHMNLVRVWLRHDYVNKYRLCFINHVPPCTSNN